MTVVGASQPGGRARPREGVTRRLYINGRFVTQKLTGVQRFGLEVVRAIDEQLASQGEAAMPASLIIPPGASCDLALTSIKVEQSGVFRGHAWEQLDLAWRARDGVLLSLCNAGPVSHRRQLVVIHDASVFRESAAYNRTYAFGHRLLGRVLSRTAKLATVSQFSRTELARIFNLPEAAVALAPNGSEHLARVDADDSAIERLGLRGGRYFLVVGSRAPHKNMELALAAAERAAAWNVRTVLVGEPNPKIFGPSSQARSASVIQAGRVSDAQLKALYRHATALLFPSRYEGFGIPLLEALVNGCPIIASDIPAAREVCGPYARYVPVDDLDALVAAMAMAAEERPEPKRAASAMRSADQFSWRATGQRLLTELQAL